MIIVVVIMLMVITKVYDGNNFDNDGLDGNDGSGDKDEGNSDYRGDYHGDFGDDCERGVKMDLGIVIIILLIYR
jgi:hypothetical protein